MSSWSGPQLSAAPVSSSAPGVHIAPGSKKGFFMYVMPSYFGDGSHHQLRTQAAKGLTTSTATEELLISSSWGSKYIKILTLGR